MVNITRNIAANLGLGLRYAFMFKFRKVAISKGDSTGGSQLHSLATFSTNGNYAQLVGVYAWDSVDSHTLWAVIRA